jgi:NAD(P)H-quinone oxidoreductase subunit I
MNLGSYFGGIRDAAKSIFEGMSVTLSHMFRKPTTVQYPDRTGGIRVADMLPERYRGLLEVEIPICTNCKLCEKACPINCIVIEEEKDAEGKKFMTRFDIDMAKCMYCGLCSEPCPTTAIRHTREFEAAHDGIEAMIFRFLEAGEQAYPFKPKQSGITPKPVFRMGEETEDFSQVEHGVIARKARDRARELNLEAIQLMRDLGLGVAGPKKKGGPKLDPKQKEEKFKKELAPAPNDKEKLAQVIEPVLAGTDCTACGYPTCRDYAVALASGKEGDTSLCSPGGEESKEDVDMIFNVVNVLRKAS